MGGKYAADRCQRTLQDLCFAVGNKEGQRGPFLNHRAHQGDGVRLIPVCEAHGGGRLGRVERLHGLIYCSVPYRGEAQGLRKLCDLTPKLSVLQKVEWLGWLTRAGLSCERDSNSRQRTRSTTTT